MALTNSGFNGSVTESDWAYMAAIGQADGVESSGAWAVTQGTGRQVSVAAQAGRSLSKGVLSKEPSVALTVSLGTPTNGQWYLIARRTNWSTDTVTVVALAHTTTSTTVPTAAPAGLPTMSATPGTEYDQPLAWAWVRSTDTTMFLVDLRKQPLGGRVDTLEATVASHTSDLANRAVQWFKPADTTARNAIAAPNNGDFAQQQDNGITYKRVSGAWKEWESAPISYTPALGTNITLGTGGTVTGSLQWVAGQPRWRALVVFGTGGTIGAGFTTNTITLPPVTIAALRHPFQDFKGTVILYDASGPVNYPGAVVAENSSTTVARIFSRAATDANITTTVPFGSAFTIGDAIEIDVMLEVA